MVGSGDVLPPMYIKKGHHRLGDVLRCCKNYPGSKLFHSSDSPMMNGRILTSLCIRASGIDCNIVTRCVWRMKLLLAFCKSMLAGCSCGRCWRAWYQAASV